MNCAATAEGKTWRGEFICWMEMQTWISEQLLLPTYYVVRYVVCTCNAITIIPHELYLTHFYICHILLCELRKEGKIQMRKQQQLQLITDQQQKPRNRVILQSSIQSTRCWDRLPVHNRSIASITRQSTVFWSTIRFNHTQTLWKNGNDVFEISKYLLVQSTSHPVDHLIMGLNSFIFITLLRSLVKSSL